MLWLLLPVATPAVACCSDFWSCAAAVASAGLSCAEEAALAGLRQLISLVHAERDAERRTFEQAATVDAEAARAVAANWARLAERARADATGCAKRAAEITSDPGPAGRKSQGVDAVGRLRLGEPATSTSPQARVTPQMQQQGAASQSQRESLTALRRRVDAAAREAQASEQATNDEAHRSQQAIEQQRGALIANQSAGVLAGFALLLARLNAASSSPASALALTADLLTLHRAIDAIRVEVERGLAPAVREASRMREDLADAPRERATATEAHARTACDTLAGMERLVRLRSLEQSEQLARDLLSAKPAASAPRERVQMTAQAAPKAVASTRTGLNALTAAVERQAIAVPAPDLPTFEARLDSELRARMYGKSPADAAQIREELLVEARRRFASDALRLSRVESLILRAKPSP